MKESKFWLMVSLMWIIAAVATLATIEDAKAAERWVVVGDFRTQAIMDAGVPGDPTNSSWSVIRRTVPVDIVNLASDAHGYAFRSEVTSAKIQIALGAGAKGVILNLGTYDWATNNTPDRMRQFMRLIIPQLKAKGLAVVCLTPLYHPDERVLRGPLSAKGYQLNYIPGLPFSVQRPSYQALMAYECQLLGAQVISGRAAPIGLSDVSAPTGTLVKPYILTTGGHAKLAIHLISNMQRLGHWVN